MNREKKIKKPKDKNNKELDLRKPSLRPTFNESYDLPPNYNTTNLTLIARDPNWIYAYWEISRESIEYLRDKLGGDMDNSTYILRMYDVNLIDFNGNNANSWFDIDVGRQANNWYINLWHDNVTYCADLGLRTPDGRFFPLARSNFVTTPRLSSSGRSDLIWMEAKDGQAQAPFVNIEEHKEKVQETQALPYSPHTRKRKIFLTENDIRAYYSRLFPLLRLVISAKGLKGRKFDIKGLKGGSLDEFLRRGLSKSQFLKRTLLGSSEELGGASEFIQGGASEREEKKRKFFFDIGTELIVYGRTEPNAEVFLGGKKINLRDDGTFTLRFNLPDGKIPLNFIAKSHDKVDQRSIDTSVERSKTIHNP